MPAPVVQLFVNATAGSVSARRVNRLRHALESEGAQVVVTPTEVGPLKLVDAATHVCAVGGDGTLRHVADAIAASGRAVPMGVYPLGTVNLLARECGYVRHPNRFARRLLADAAPRLHHIGRIGEVRMFTCASVGPDSYAVARASLRAKRLVGRAAYALAIIGVLLRWRRPALQLTIGGRTIACEAVYVAKGRYYAGPWTFAPQARTESSSFHVVALRKARRRDFARFCWQLLVGSELSGDGNLLCLTATHLAIAGGDLPLQADGDIVAHLPVELRIDPAPMPFV